MSEAKIDGVYNLTHPAILRTFKDQLFVPKSYIGKNGKPQGEPKYNGEFIFSAGHPDLPAMKELVAGLARARWPDKPFTELSFPFQSGDKINAKREAKEKKGDEYLRGTVVMNIKSKFVPKYAYLENGKFIDLETETAIQTAKSKFYSGVEVLAQFNFVPYDPIGENAKGGVTAYLNMVVSTNKGKKLAPGKSSSEVFKGYAGSVSAEDPTTGLDDVMGF